LGDFERQPCWVCLSIDFENALVLTNDHWKSLAAGIPHNSFLVATALNPENPAATPNIFDNELILLRVQGPANLPSDSEMVKTRIEHNQRREANDRFVKDANDGFTP